MFGVAMSNENIEELNETAEPETTDKTLTENNTEPSENSVSENPSATDVSKTPETVTGSTEKAKSKKSDKTGMPAKKKLKLFKLIYYPVLALFVALMFVFSALDGAVGYSPSAYGDGYYTAVNTHVKALTDSSRSSASVGGAGAAREYITETLIAGGFVSEEEVKTEKDETATEFQVIDTLTDYAEAGGAKTATVTLQTSALEGDIQNSLGLDKTLVGATCVNVVAAIPSTAENAGAVVITVRYDSRDDSAEAGNAAFVGNAVQTLIELRKSGKKFKNDIVVVFTQDYGMSYGAYAFFNRFKGFDDVVARATVGVNLEAYGNGGTLALVDSSNAGYDYINAYTKVSGTVFNSSVTQASVSDKLINKHAVKAFGSIPAVQVAVLGGLDSAQSGRDDAENLSQAIVKQQAQFLADYIEKFADDTDKYSAGGSSDTAVISYLDGGTIAYTSTASYVVGALILALLIGTVVATAIKKTFSVKNMLKAVAVQLAVVLTTLVAMYAAYFLTTLMLTGFGVLPIHAITQLRYLNAGIMIAAVLISVAAAFGATTLFKKLFKVTSSDVVRGTAVLFGLVGAIMSFACPAYSFMTNWLGLLMLATLLATVCLHKKFKNKFGFGMDRLYLFAIPVALCLPFIMSSVVSAITLLPLVLMPLIMTVFTALLGIGVPYLDRTQPLLDRVAKKLPDRTVRVQRTVTEKVEDRAKKGKFTEVTYRKVVKEKMPRNYKNYFGISVVTVLAIVIALFSGGFGVSFDKTLTDYQMYADSIYNDSIVYELDFGTSSTPEQKIVVGDLMAYKFMRYELTDLEWDGTRYAKSVNYNIISDDKPSITKTDNDREYNVKPYLGAQSVVTLTIHSARNITKITVKERNKNFGEDYEGYVYEFANCEDIVLSLPYGFDSEFTLTLEGASLTQVEYEERIVVLPSDSRLDAVDEWNRIRFNSDMPGLRAGIVIKSTISI